MLLRKRWEVQSIPPLMLSIDESFVFSLMLRIYESSVYLSPEGSIYPPPSMMSIDDGSVHLLPDTECRRGLHLSLPR
jgi:hypothetical protein